MIINLKIVLRELLGLADRIRAQAFCIYKLTEVIMVNQNEDLIFIDFQVVASSFKNFNNSQKFLIIGFVSSLNKAHFLRKKNY